MLVADVMKGAGHCGVYAGSMVLFPLACLSAYTAEAIFALTASQESRAAFHAMITASLWSPITATSDFIGAHDVSDRIKVMFLCSEFGYLIPSIACSSVEVPLALAWVGGMLMVAVGLGLHAFGMWLDPQPSQPFRFFSSQPVITRLDDLAFDAARLGV